MSTWESDARAAIERLAGGPDPVARATLAELWQGREPQERPDWLQDGYQRWVLPPASTGLPVATERLTLRLPTGADGPAIHAMYSNPEVVRHVPFGVLTEAECVARCEAVAAPEVQDGRLLVRPLVVHEGRVVGELTLGLAGPTFSVAEVGWALHPEVTGRGFAHEAARALVDLAFTHYGVHRVFANLDTRNEASARLCERLGMTRETHARQDYWSKGEWTDSYIYAVLRD